MTTELYKERAAYWRREANAADSNAAAARRNGDVWGAFRWEQEATQCRREARCYDPMFKQDDDA